MLVTHEKRFLRQALHIVAGEKEERFESTWKVQAAVVPSKQPSILSNILSNLSNFNLKNVQHKNIYVQCNLCKTQNTVAVICKDLN